MNISSLIVYTRSGDTDAVCHSLDAFEGVEVHARAPDGRLIATMETADPAASTRLYESIERTTGVVSVALVYQHNEAFQE